MKLLSILLVMTSVLTGCTSITVRPVPKSARVKHVCIHENPKVKVHDFLTVLQDGFHRHGISTEVVPGNLYPKSDFVLTYTALRSWDFAPYLSHAEVRLERNGSQVAYGEYHLIGKGGYSMMKWMGTKSKMDPVIDKLLAEYQ